MFLNYFQYISLPGARVRRLLTHRVEQSWIVSSCQGNNEISMWDMETGARQKTLWASSAPALSTTQVYPPLSLTNHMIFPSAHCFSFFSIVLTHHYVTKV